MGYGDAFCYKFKAERGRLSEPRGQAWMVDVMQCLQVALVPDAVEMEKEVRERGVWVRGEEKCEALKKKAFDSHSECYVGTGMCDLGWRDWGAIASVVKWKLFATAEARKEVGEVLGTCVRRWLGGWWFWIL